MFTIRKATAMVMIATAVFGLLISFPGKVNAATYDVSNSEEMGAAHAEYYYSSDSSITINITGSFTYTASIHLINKNCTINLNGNTFTCAPVSGPGLYLENSSLSVVGSGTLNLNGTTEGVNAQKNSDLRITSGAVINANGSGSYGVYANNSSITVSSAAGHSGVYAVSGSTVSVSGNVSGTNLHGASAQENGTVTVTGSATGALYGAYAVTGSSVTIGGNATGGQYGAFANGNSSITVSGDAAGTSVSGVYADNNSTVRVSKDAKGNYGAMAGHGSKVYVIRDILGNNKNDVGLVSGGDTKTFSKDNPSNTGVRLPSPDNGYDWDEFTNGTSYVYKRRDVSSNTPVPTAVPTVPPANTPAPPPPAAPTPAATPGTQATPQPTPKPDATPTPSPTPKPDATPTPKPDTTPTPGTTPSNTDTPKPDATPGPDNTPNPGSTPATGTDTTPEPGTPQDSNPFDFWYYDPDRIILANDGSTWPAGDIPFNKGETAGSVAYSGGGETAGSVAYSGGGETAGGVARYIGETAGSVAIIQGETAGSVAVIDTKTGDTIAMITGETAGSVAVYTGGETAGSVAYSGGNHETAGSVAWSGAETAGSVAWKIEQPYETFAYLHDGSSKLNPDSYTIVQGSTIVFLSGEYIQTLENGLYTFTAQFADAYSELLLLVFIDDEIQAESSGIHPAVYICFAVGLVFIAASAVLFIRNRKTAKTDIQ